MVEEPVPGTVEGLKLAEAPAGKPLELKVTAPAKLTCGVTAIVNVVLAPCATDCLFGVADIVKSGTACGLKKIPLVTALLPPVRVTRMAICPLKFHKSQTPGPNDVRLRVSRTFPLATSVTVTLSARPPSQSRQYKPTWCALPSVRFTSKVRLLDVYQAEAILSLAEAFCGARTSVVDAAQV